MASDHRGVPDRLPVGAWCTCPMPIGGVRCRFCFIIERFLKGNYFPPPPNPDDLDVISSDASGRTGIGAHRGHALVLARLLRDFVRHWACRSPTPSALAALCAALWMDIPLEAIALKTSDGMDDFPLLAIPFFMCWPARSWPKAGWPERIINLAKHIRGLHPRRPSPW